jgi:hypothetical protein
MTERLGAVAYRHLAARAVLNGTGDGDSLENIITNPLNDGCLCYVVAEKAYYLLDKQSTAAPVPGFIVQPLGGPGRWILVFIGSFTTEFSAEIFLDSTPDLGEPNLIVTPVSGGHWTPGPIDATYTAVLSPVFDADLTTGVLTYKGPPRRYLLQVYATMASGSPLMGLTADAGGDRLGDSFDDGTEGVVANLGAQMILTASRSVNLFPTQPIQAAVTDTDLGNPPLATDITIRRLHLVATPFI